MNPEEPITTSTQSITLKDVLQAIFMPPQDDQPPALPTISARQLWSALPGTGTSEAALDLSKLAQPTTIHYEAAPIEPADETSPRRIMTLGIGVVITLLIAYLAQSSLSSHRGGVAGTLFYGLAIVIWLGLLAFEFAPPDRA